jgi:hypothetical protein
MSESVYKAALDTMVEKLSKALDDRNRIEQDLDKVTSDIESLRETISSLSRLCGIDHLTEYSHLFPINKALDMGITTAIAMILEKPPYVPMSAIDVRDKLDEMGFKIHEYSNPLATIHTVLKRFHRQGKVTTEKLDGRQHYIWEPKQ